MNSISNQIWIGLCKPIISVCKRSLLIFSLFNFVTLYPDTVEVVNIRDKWIVGGIDVFLGLLYLVLYRYLGTVKEHEESKIHGVIFIAVASAVLQTLVAMSLTVRINFTVDLIIVMFLNASFQRNDKYYWAIQLSSVWFWGIVVYFRCILSQSMTQVSLIHWGVVMVCAILVQELIRTHTERILKLYVTTKKM